MNETPNHFFTKTVAAFLAFQNTQDDGEWVYKAEPVEGNAAGLYIVTIYGEDGEKIGTL